MNQNQVQALVIGAVLILGGLYIWLIQSAIAMGFYCRMAWERHKALKTGHDWPSKGR